MANASIDVDKVINRLTELKKDIDSSFDSTFSGDVISTNTHPTIDDVKKHMQTTVDKAIDQVIKDVKDIGTLVTGFDPSSS